jgi:hypothetical protein
MLGKCPPLLVMLTALLLAGCATPSQEPVVVVVEEPGPQPEPDPEPQPEIVEPDPEPEEPAEPEPEPEPEPQPEEPVAPIEVPDEVYNQAFAEVEAIIDDLNRIISQRQFETWKTYLTERYIEYYSDPEVLDELSREPILAQNRIRLNSLRDYFRNVVVPSRARVRLDDLIFYSDTLVEAKMEIRGVRATLYVLRKIDGEWKIDTLETLPSDGDSSDESPEGG